MPLPTGWALAQNADGATFGEVIFQSTTRGGVMPLYPVPLELKEANALVAAWHRHHKPVVGHRFSIGVIDENGVLHGAAIVGRPVARLAGHPRDVLEVTRLVTDGTKNACSLLYAAAARAGAACGYRRIQTYILGDETGASLRAAGWTYEGEAGGGQWKHTDGKPRRTDQPTGIKGRWAKQLNERPGIAWPGEADLPLIMQRIRKPHEQSLFEEEIA